MKNINSNEHIKMHYLPLNKSSEMSVKVTSWMGHFLLVWLRSKWHYGQFRTVTPHSD